jgi:pimeloyl-ACP methyl ester carboxylesterase
MLDHYLNATKNSTSVLKRITGYLFFGLYKLAPARVGPWLLRLFFRPGIALQGEQEKSVWAAGSAFEFESHGRRICGRYWGNGPGVLMVHGWDGRGSQFHRLVEPIVTAGYRAIAFDAPAHGESAGLETNYFEYTDAVRHLLRGDAGMPVDKVVAHSFGAAATINAIDKEGLAPDLLLIAPALRLEEFLQTSFQRHGIPFGLFREIIGRLETHYGYDFHRDNPERLISRLAQPCMILHDEFDRLVPIEQSRAATEANPRVSLQSTRDLGHTRILKSDTAIAAVNGYLLEQLSEAS